MFSRLARVGRGGAETVLQVLVALADDLQVEGQHQRVAAGGLGAVDQAFDEIAVAHHVELEPERLADFRGDVLQGTDAHGRQGVAHAELGGGAGGEDLAVGMLHAGQPGGRDDHRHGHLLAEHAGAQRAVLDVPRDPLAQLDRGEVVLVGAVGAFAPGTGVGVVVEHPRHALARQAAQVFDIGDDAHAVHSFGGGWMVERDVPPQAE